MFDGDVFGSHEGGEDGDEGEDAGKDVEGLLVKDVLETGSLIVKLVDKVHDGAASVAFGLGVTLHHDESS